MYAPATIGTLFTTCMLWYYPSVYLKLVTNLQELQTFTHKRLTHQQQKRTLNLSHTGEARLKFSNAIVYNKVMKYDH